MNSFADCALFCKREGSIISFVASVGLPREGPEYWECDWSMGNLFPHDLAPALSINSMLALSPALKDVVVFLKGRCDAGDTFYLDQELSEPIEDIVEFLVV